MGKKDKNKSLKKKKKEELKPRQLKKKLKKHYPQFLNLRGDEILERLDLVEKMGLKPAGSKISRLPKHKDARPAKDAFSNNGRPFFVIAHRGWSGSYPENTLIGMREAIKLGCHMIEFDVTLTKDRKVIIIHDEVLSRTTNGAGHIKDWNYADLRRLDAGAWFHPRYKGAKLPSLDEVLLISRGSGIHVNIEIKKEAWDEEAKADNIENQVLEKIHKYRVKDRVLISSFRWGFIERIHKADPSIRTALLHYKDVGKLNVRELVRQYGPWSFNPHSIELTKKFVDECHKVGLRVFPFTINSYQDMQTFFDMGVDGMFTNHPNRLFKFIKKQNMMIEQFGQLETVEDKSDVELAIKRLEEEEMRKAGRRARWRAKRMLLEQEKAHQPPVVES